MEILVLILNHIVIYTLIMYVTVLIRFYISFETPPGYLIKIVTHVMTVYLSTVLDSISVTVLLSFKINIRSSIVEELKHIFEFQMQKLTCKSLTNGVEGH